MPAILIVTFPATEAYLADIKILDKAFEIVTKYEGCINVYYGLHAEDPKTGIYVVPWETYEHHMAALQRADLPDLIAELSPAWGGQPVINHIMTDKEIGDSVYSAPITEFAIWKLKEGRTGEEIRLKLVELAQVLDDAEGTRPPCVWGRCKEDDKTFYVTAGWESMQAHADAVSPQGVRDLLDSIKEMADLEIFHAGLKRFLD